MATTSVARHVVELVDLQSSYSLGSSNIHVDDADRIHFTRTVYSKSCPASTITVVNINHPAVVTTKLPTIVDKMQVLSNDKYICLCDDGQISLYDQTDGLHDLVKVSLAPKERVKNIFMDTQGSYYIGCIRHLNQLVVRKYTPATNTLVELFVISDKYAFYRSQLLGIINDQLIVFSPDPRSITIRTFSLDGVEIKQAVLPLEEGIRHHMKTRVMSKSGLIAVHMSHHKYGDSSNKRWNVIIMTLDGVVIECLENIVETNKLAWNSRDQLYIIGHRGNVRMW